MRSVYTRGDSSLAVKTKNGSLRGSPRCSAKASAENRAQKDTKLSLDCCLRLSILCSCLLVLLVLRKKRIQNSRLARLPRPAPDSKLGAARAGVFFCWRAPLFRFFLRGWWGEKIWPRRPAPSQADLGGGEEAS